MEGSLLENSRCYGLLTSLLDKQYIAECRLLKTLGWLTDRGWNCSHGKHSNDSTFIGNPKPSYSLNFAFDPDLSIVNCPISVTHQSWLDFRKKKFRTKFRIKQTRSNISPNEIKRYLVCCDRFSINYLFARSGRTKKSFNRITTFFAEIAAGQ